MGSSYRPVVLELAAGPEGPVMTHLPLRATQHALGPSQVYHDIMQTSRFSSPSLKIALISAGFALPLVPGLAAASPAGAATRPAVQATKGASKATKQKALYWSEHPCQLFTQKEVNKVLGAPMKVDQNGPSAYGGQCGYQTTGTNMWAALSYGFQPGTAASARSDLSGTYTAEKSVEAGAYCMDTHNHTVNFELPVGTMQGGPYRLDIAVETCPMGVALGKVAVSEIVGA